MGIVNKDSLKKLMLCLTDIEIQVLARIETKLCSVFELYCLKQIYVKFSNQRLTNKLNLDLKKHDK